MRDKRNKFVGDVTAVECEGCIVETHTIPVGVLGLKNLKIKVEDGVVTVANKSWIRKHMHHSGRLADENRVRDLCNDRA